MTAPFSLFEPVDETSSWTISFQGRSDANCFRSQLVSAAAVDHPALVAAADQEDRPLGREILGEVGMIEQVLDQLVPLVASLACCRNARASCTLGIRPSRSR